MPKSLVTEGSQSLSPDLSVSWSPAEVLIPHGLSVISHDKSGMLNADNKDSTITGAKLRKRSRCPTAEEWTRKMRCIQTMDAFSASKNNDMISLAGKWI